MDESHSLAKIQAEVNWLREQCNALTELVLSSAKNWKHMELRERLAVKSRLRELLNFICASFDRLDEKYIADNFWPHGENTYTKFDFIQLAMDCDLESEVSPFILPAFLYANILRLQRLLPDEIEWGTKSMLSMLMGENI